MDRSLVRSPRKPSRGVTALVLMAACSGSARLSAATGLPLIHISVTRDREATLRRMNETAHGSAVRWPRSFQPLAFESGWDSWAAFRLEATRLARPAPPGVLFVDGAIAVELPDETVLQEFAAELSAALRHLRLQEAVIRPGFLEELSAADPFADVCVHPRYTPRSPFDFRDAALVTDLFAFDPAEDVWRLAWLAAAARLAACEGQGVQWP